MSDEISAAAQQARERLQDEIDRVRLGVEEMLEQSAVAVDPAGQSNEQLRAELEELRLETRDYVKRRVRKSEKRLRSSVNEVASRADEIEARLDRVEAERSEAEARIHENTEQLLDGLLAEVRAIADRLEAMPTPISAAAGPKRLRRAV